MSDQQILQQLKNSHPDGLKQLFYKYYEFLTRAAFYITKDKAASEDLVQDLFVRTWDKRMALPDIVNFKAYLTQAVKNSALDFVEKQRSGQTKLDHYIYLEQQKPEMSSLDIDELRDKLSRSLSCLPPRCRLIFAMNRFEGLSNDEIAEYLEISKRTVETQITKALKILRTELKNVWDHHLLGLLF